MKTNNLLAALFIVSFIFCATQRMAAQSVSTPYGILGWWPADCNANDVIGDNNGMLQGGATLSTGKIGRAFDLDGSTGYVAAPDSDLWAFGTNDFTIELWVNFRDWSPSGNIYYPEAIFIGNDEGGGDLNKWWFASDEGKLSFHINSPTLGPQFVSATTFSPLTNQWYHVAVTRSGNLFTFYTNGVLAGSTNFSVVIPNPSAPLTIGEAEQMSFMDGELDEVSIYGRALSSTEIQSIYNAQTMGKILPYQTPADIVAWWPGNNTNANDIIGTNNGTMIYGASFGLGMANQAFSLGGATPCTRPSTGPSVEIPDNDLWAFGTNDFTIELWANFKSLPPAGCARLGYPYGGMFISNDEGSGGNNKWWFALDGSVLDFHINGPTINGGSGVFLVQAPFSPQTNQWYHFAVTRSGNLYTIYTNGVAIGSQTDTNVIPNPDAPLVIGAAEGFYFNGLLDEVSIYNRALSSNEVQSIYVVQGADKTHPVSAPPGIVNWWPGNGNADDLIGKQNGTLIDGVSYGLGEVNQAFSLGGVTPCTRPSTGPSVEVDSTNNVWSFGTNDFSIELWANFKSLPPGGCARLGYPYGGMFISDDEGSGGNNKWWFALDGSVLDFHINGPTINGGSGVFLVQAPFSPQTNQWYHFAVTRSGNLYTIYTNGVAIGSQTDTNVIPQIDAPLFIGAGEGFYFNGLIDEATIYQRALSPCEVYSIYDAGGAGKIHPVPASTNIVAWWPANDNAIDIIGGNDGTLEDGASYATGEPAQAFSLDGSTGYVSVPDSDTWAFGDNNFSIELWAYFNSVPDSSIGSPGNMLLSSCEGGGDVNKWWFALGGGVLSFHINDPVNGPVFLVQAPFAPEVDQWYHLVVVRNGDEYTIYANGIALGSDTSSRSVPNADAPLRIGQAEDSYFLDGRLDEVSIYGQALSESGIKAIYHAGGAGKYKQ